MEDASLGEDFRGILAVIGDKSDAQATMATIASMVYFADERFDWVGFYRNIDGANLRIGAYQGRLGCLDIAFGRGVCGYVAKTGEAIIVPDVDAFADHIACSSSTRSEMVLPVKNAKGELLAVFDLDSNQPDAFREDDRARLQIILDAAFADTSLEDMK